MKNKIPDNGFMIDPEKIKKMMGSNYYEPKISRTLEKSQAFL